jgi:alpha-amylase
MPEYNGVMLQFFHWYTPADGTLWSELAERAKELAEVGFTSVWLPPAYKGAGGKADVGYGVYDLFDLGEFDQKGSVRTKYGTREEYVRAISVAHEAGLQVYGDVVFNHRLGGDEPEEFNATPYNSENRNEPMGEMKTIKAWTHFKFPGRNGRYSQMEWHWWHFKAADYNAFDEKTEAIYLFEGKKFDADVDNEKGNFDFLLGCDVDVNNDEVRKDLYRWGEWYLEITGIDGFRFDAVRHVKRIFFMDWLNHMRQHSGKDLFAVGEYLSRDIEGQKRFIMETNGNMALFDAALHYNFSEASKEGERYDMRRLFDNTLVKEMPLLSVTFVSNHDTQPLQKAESVVEPWFKPIAYAIILLRREGYPCVFAADYDGAKYRDVGKDGKEYDVEIPSHRWLIDRFLSVRRNFAYGEQRDYFDHPNCVGWVRLGDEEHPGGLVVLLSNGAEGTKVMQTAMPNTRFIDMTEHIKEPIFTDGEGKGEFRCNGGSVSVWIRD